MIRTKMTCLAALVAGMVAVILMITALGACIDASAQIRSPAKCDIGHGLLVRRQHVATVLCQILRSVQTDYLGQLSHGGSERWGLKEDHP